MSTLPESAFPTAERGDHGIKGGLTKREIIAAMILQAIISSGKPVMETWTNSSNAVLAADALLQELNGGN